MSMNDSRQKLSLAAWLVGGFLLLSGAGTWTFVVKAAGSGVLGESARLWIDWLVGKTPTPEDLDFQRQLARQREAERERQADFERTQTELEAAHRRRMQEIQAEQHLKETEDRIQESEHKRKLEELARIARQQAPPANQSANASTPSPNVSSARPNSSIEREPKFIGYSPGIKLFDANGAPLAWYYRDENGAIEVYDSPGYHPRSGGRLLAVTKEIATELQRVATNCLTYLNEVNENGHGRFVGIIVDCTPQK